MAITNTKQDWTIGKVVQVGFCRLTVVAHRNDIVELQSKSGKLYEFTPYLGLYKVS